MIQANELRIGNLVFRDELNIENGKWDELTIKINYQDIFNLINGNDMVKTAYNPIPLTEEWLIKLGFKQWVNFGRKTYNYDLMPLCNFSYCFVTKKVMILEKGNNMSHWIERKIEYVHELQNLYFSLRGKELTITH